MQIIKEIVGLVRTNCYIVKHGKDCFIVDPGDDAQRIIEDTHNCQLRFILLTHGHFDHVLALEAIEGQYPGTDIYIGKKDKELINHLSSQGFSINQHLKDIKMPIKTVRQGNTIAFGSHKIKVIDTPGHTEGSVCYLLNNLLFSGDTLFYHTIGRTDLPNSDPISMLDSLKKLADLSVETKVYPGHGPETTIKEEIRNGYVSKILMWSLITIVSFRLKARIDRSGLYQIYVTI